MKPRISLLLLAYNQASVVEAAVRSCLAQECEAIEIVLSDDASTDDTHAILCELASTYTGPHQVRVRRNPVNLGIGEHYNRAIADSVGQLLVTAAGDDISLPNRVRTLAAAWDSNGQKADLLASYLWDMDAAGVNIGQIEVDDLSRWRSPDDWVRKRPFVVGASHAFTRRMHERFGPIRADLPYEDQAMALRACCMGGGLTVPEALVRYRRGGVSAGGRSQQTASENRKRLRVKHERQLALYRQVQQDLAVVGRLDLWPGKMERKLRRSALVLALQDARNGRDRWKLVLQSQQAGRAWSAFQAVNAQWPALAAAWSNLRRR